MLGFSVKCSVCGTINQKEAENVFDFMATERVAGWVIPDVTENKPILCPACKDKLK